MILLGVHSNVSKSCLCSFLHKNVPNARAQLYCSFRQNIPTTHTVFLNGSWSTVHINSDKLHVKSEITGAYFYAYSHSS